MRHSHSTRLAVRTLQCLAIFVMAFAMCVLVSRPAWAQASSPQNMVDRPLDQLHTPQQVLTGEAQLIGPYTASPKLRLVLALQPPHYGGRTTIPCRPSEPKVASVSPVPHSAGMGYPLRAE